MKAVCNSCKFEVSGADKKQLDDNFRCHLMTFGHSGFYIIDYD